MPSNLKKDIVISKVFNNFLSHSAKKVLYDRNYLFCIRIIKRIFLKEIIIFEQNHNNLGKVGLSREQVLKVNKNILTVHVIRNLLDNNLETLLEM